MARPNPVAPPVTTTTRPDRFSPARCSSGRSCTTAAPPGAGASRPASVHEYGAKEFEPMFEFEARQAAPYLPTVRRLGSILLCGAIAALGALAFALLALARGESVTAAWLLIAAVR